MVAAADRPAAACQLAVSLLCTSRCALLAARGCREKQRHPKREGHFLAETAGRAGGDGDFADEAGLVENGIHVLVRGGPRDQIGGQAPALRVTCKRILVGEVSMVPPPPRSRRDEVKAGCRYSIAWFPPPANKRGFTLVNRRLIRHPAKL